MKKITINSENRRFNISSIAIGYLDENKVEQIEFEIPQEYQNYGKKACFSANGTTFAKLFDDITSNILTITRDISQYNELDLSIEFFKAENEDEIIARTSILHIVIENAIICDDDVSPDDDKVIILDGLIEKVTNLESETTKNEKLRQENEQNRIKNEEERIQYFDDIKEKVENGDFNGKDAMINGVNTLEIIEGDNIHLEQQANVLTISNTYSYDDSQLKADIEKINRNLNNYSLITETGSKVALNINPSTYVMTLELKDKNNNTISSGNVDLPLETMVVGATYNNETKEIELTLQNGTEVSFSVADLVSGLVNENDLTTKLNDYALKTSIPTKTSQLNNDSGFMDKSVNNLDNYYKKTEIDTKVQAINTTTSGLNTRLTTVEKNIETNKTDIKDLSNRTKRIETDIFDSGEASGTGINLQDSTLAEFQEVKIDGVGNRETTNGNQILDFANPTSKSVGVTSTFENNILTIVGNQGTMYQSAFWNLSSGFLEKNKGKTIKYKNKSSKTTNSSTNSIVQVITKYTDGTPTTYRQLYNLSNGIPVNDYVIPQDISKLTSVVVGFYTNNSANTDVENTITIEEPLLYFDDNDTYEPYTGGEPSPSPDYKQPIEVITEDFDLVSCGKNILQLKFTTNPTSVGGANFNYTSNTFTIKGTPTSTYSIYKLKDNISIIDGEDYTFSAKVNGVNPKMVITIVAYDYNNKSIFAMQMDKNINYKKSMTINTNGKKIKYYTFIIEGLLVGEEYDLSAEVQLEKNTTATEYEPYTETRQTITMPEEEFAGKINDTYKDQFRINYSEQDGKYHLYLDKNIGKEIFNGDENVALRSDITNVPNTSFFRITSFDYLKVGDLIGICNYFGYSTTNEKNTMRLTKNQYYAIQFGISSNIANTAQEFKQWLSTHNTEVYYVLAEPYTLDLGVVNMPLSYYPITNVYNTCVGIPNMYVKYYRDFKKTVTTMQVDIENLKEAVSTLTSSQTNMANNISTLQNVISSSLEEETESEVVTE